MVGCKNTEEAPPKSVVELVPYEVGVSNCASIISDNPDSYYGLINNCMVGSQMPEFSATTIDGNPIELDDMNGKVSVVNFWFTTCKPCIAEIPGLNLVVEKFGREKCTDSPLERVHKL